MKCLKHDGAFKWPRRDPAQMELVASPLRWARTTGSVVRDSSSMAQPVFRASKSRLLRQAANERQGRQAWVLLLSGRLPEEAGLGRASPLFGWKTNRREPPHGAVRAHLESISVPSAKVGGIILSTFALEDLCTGLNCAFCSLLPYLGS